MLGVIFHWDHKQGLESTGRRNLFQRYDYTCRAFGVDSVVAVVIDDDFDVSPDHVLPVPSLDEALTKFYGCTPVLLAKEGSVNLADFKHPKNAVYIVGPDYEGIKIPQNAVTVHVQYPNKGMELWATAVLGITLYDRSVKWQ